MNLTEQEKINLEYAVSKDPKWAANEIYMLRRQLSRGPHKKIKDLQEELYGLKTIVHTELTAGNYDDVLKNLAGFLGRIFSPLKMPFLLIIKRDDEEDCLDVASNVDEDEILAGLCSEASDALKKKIADKIKGESHD